MNDIKKVLIAAICVVLVVAIAAGVSIGVLAGTVNGLKDTVAELQQANEAQASLNASMKAEIEAAKNNEELVTAAEFEAKLAEALGAQTQTMQALITTAVKNQIEELGVEGLTEAQVQTIIDAAVENCLTEDDIDAIIADLDTGLTKDEVKKIVADYTAGTLTYGQIVNMIDDADYDLRAYLEGKMATMKKYLEDKIAGVQEGLTTEIEIYAEDAVNGVYTIDSALVANLVNAEYSIVTLCADDDWSEITIVIDDELTKSFNLSVTTNVKEVVLGAETVRVSIEDDVETWAIVDGKMKYAFTEGGATVTISGEGAVVASAFRGDKVLSTVIIEKGITSLGYRSFRDCTNLTSIILPEGMTTIGEEALRGTTKLETIVIPSTVETIGKCAFQLSGLKAVTIPATVKTMEEGAFRDIASIETVIIEGNTTIANYAFRRAESLKTVILKGEPTFTGTSMAFSNKESGESNDITIYVINDEVAAAVKTANGSCTGYTISKPATSATVKDVFANVEDGGVVVLGEGTFCPEKKNGNFTIIGTGDTVITLGKADGEGASYNFDGSNVVFENLTIKTDGNWCSGIARMSATYNNCVIENTYCLYGKSEFNNCTFKVSGDNYNIWTYGSPEVTFNNCTFYCDGKAIYADGNGNTGTKITLNDCVFVDRTNGERFKKAAIETGTTYGKTYELIINNIEISGFAVNPDGIVTNTEIWANKHSMTTDKLNVVIDGKDVY